MGEFVRDNALAISGLLNRTFGGVQVHRLFFDERPDDPDITWILEQSSNLINWTVLTPQDTIQTETELRLRIDRPASQVYLRVRLTLSVSP